MTLFLDAALQYAERGWRVFPVHTIFGGRCTCGRRDCSSPGKHPLVRRGVHDATTEPRVIEEWWRRWRRANIAIATGQESGLVVVDLDLPAALGSLDRLVDRLPLTLTSLTGGGGLHLLLRPDEADPSAATSPGKKGAATPSITRVSGGSVHDHTRSGRVRLRNHAGRLPGIDGDLPGVDLRAEGGYILAPPSLHISGARYAWLDPSVPIADAPEWLREPLRVARPSVAPHPPRFTDGVGTPYGRAALERAVETIHSAPVGRRNHTLNREAFCIAQLVAGGELLESAARHQLQMAGLASGLDTHEVHRTVESAFGAGAAQARSPSLKLR